MTYIQSYGLLEALIAQNSHLRGRVLLLVFFHPGCKLESDLSLANAGQPNDCGHLRLFLFGQHVSKLAWYLFSSHTVLFLGGGDLRRGWQLLSVAMSAVSEARLSCISAVPITRRLLMECSQFLPSRLFAKNVWKPASRWM